MIYTFSALYRGRWWVLGVLACLTASCFLIGRAYIAHLAYLHPATMSTQATAEHRNTRTETHQIARPDGTKETVTVRTDLSVLAKESKATSSPVFEPGAGGIRLALAAAWMPLEGTIRAGAGLALGPASIVALNPIPASFSLFGAALPAGFRFEPEVLGIWRF